MADVCAEMVFHYQGRFDELTNGKSENSSLTAVQGPSLQIRRFKTDHPFGIFGVYLYPYSIPLLFDMPSTELYNQMPDLVSLMGAKGKILEEKIMLASDNNARVKIMTGFLEERLQKRQQNQHPVFSAIQYVIQSQGQIRIEALASQHFISHRQFERKFKEYSGLSPKLFSRIVRFHNACQHFGQSTRSLTELAYECGYYDQSHFIHDFKEFSGFHPKQYFSGITEGTEWRTPIDAN